MYVVIDRDRMCFLYKHPNPWLLADLILIECPDASIEIQPCDGPNFLSEFTDLELKLLYNHTTGAEQKHYGANLRAVLTELVYRMDLFDGIDTEVAAQAQWCDEAKSDESFVYVKKSNRPCKADPGQQPAPIKVPVFAKEVEIAKMGRNAAAALYGTAPRATVAPITAPASAALRTARAPSAPRAGGVREVIWKVADQLWEAAGKPIDKSQILVLRKEMMRVLEEEHQVKRTSSSNELGNWQKARI